MPDAVVERTRVCLKCPENGEQPWSAFYPGKKWPDGTTRYPQGVCKACRKATNAAECAAYYARLKANPERLAVLRDQQREYARRRYGITPDRYRADFVGSAQQTVDAGPIREAVEASGLGPSLIARRAGFKEESPVRRAIRADRVSVRTATRILAAIGVAPHEVGL